MGKVVPMAQNYSQIIGTCPGHHGQLISQNCVLTKIRAELGRNITTGSEI